MAQDDVGQLPSASLGHYAALSFIVKGRSLQIANKACPYMIPENLNCTLPAAGCQLLPAFWRAQRPALLNSLAL